MLHFTMFNTQLSKDFVRVFQCTNVLCSQQQQLAELSGSYSSVQTVTSSTGYMRVVFTSDGSINSDGFNASWNLVSICVSCFQNLQPIRVSTVYADLVPNLQVPADFPCTGCGSTCGLLTASSGIFSDGSGMSNYPSNSSCEWMIVTTNAVLITLNFVEFSTQSSRDIVRVLQCLDSVCSQQQQLAELSGTYPSAQAVTSTTGFVKVVFMSDSTGEYDGFTATWSMVSLPYVMQHMHPSCNMNCDLT
jgi:hypothetical protein